MSKRSFYSDDEQTLPTPGLNSPISKDLSTSESKHISSSTTRLIDGKLLTSFTFLESWSKTARSYLVNKLDIFNAETDNLKSALNNELSIVSITYKNLKSEDLLPNSLYILTSTLTGSIIARNRGFTARFFVPLILGASSFSYFMPHTFNNIGDAIGRQLRLYTPELMAVKDQCCNTLDASVNNVNEFEKQMEVELISKVGEVRRLIVGESDK